MKYKGLTLIEMIIMIGVFSIGILTVLTLLSDSLNILDRVDLRTQATFFSKEGIDLVYNMRDSNYKKELPWDCIVKNDIYSGGLNKNNPGLLKNNETGLDKFCGNYFSDLTWNVLQVWYDKDAYIYADVIDYDSDFNTRFTNNQLYLFTWENWLNWYWYCKSCDNPSFFARYIKFDEITEWENNFLSWWLILKVESHVLWNKGSRTGEVIMESFIWNY